MTDPLGLVRFLAISDEHYLLMGKITVIGSMLEARMKAFPINMARPNLPAGWAFTAHSNFRSLCDMSSAIAREEFAEPFAEEIAKSVKAAMAAYDRRNELVHYSYGPGNGEDNDAHGYRLMARERLAHRFKKFTVAELTSILDDLTSAFNGIEECYQAMLVLRSKRSPAPQGSRIHTLAQLATQRTP